MYLFFTTYTSFIHGEGSSWSFNQPDGKERHRSQSHLSCHSPLCAPLVSRHFPFLAFNIFFTFVSSTHHSISISPSLSPPLSLTHSFPFSPRGAEVVEGHSDLARFQHGGSEKGGENETTRVQQCTVNTFTPIKLVKTSKNAIWKCCGPDWCPRCALAEACPKTFLTASICYALEHLADTTHAPATEKQSVLLTRDSRNERTA